MWSHVEENQNGTRFYVHILSKKREFEESKSRLWYSYGIPFLAWQSMAICAEKQNYEVNASRDSRVIRGWRRVYNFARVFVPALENFT